MLTNKILNLLKGFIYFNYKKERVYNYPLVYAIETTNRCNLECVMCPHKKMTRSQGVMNIDLFKKVIEQIKDYQTSVWLDNYGEPLLDPYIFDRIKYCKMYNIKTKLSTNATFLSHENSLKLLNSGLDLIFLCLDGTTKDIYEKLRVKGKFEQVRDNIKNFIALKRKTSAKTYTILQLIRTKLTEESYLSFYKEWEIEGVDQIFFKNFSTFGGQLDNFEELSMPEQRYREKLPKKRPPCYYLWHSVVILWDGRIVPCCRDYNAKLILGNLSKETLKQIWNGKKLISLRSKQINGNFNNPLCKNCIEYPPFSPDYLLLLKNIKALLAKLRQKWSL